MLTRFVVRHRIPVLRRLLPGVKHVWARLTWTRGFRVVPSGGALFLLNHRNKVDRSVGLVGHFEVRQLAFLKQAVHHHQCSVFLDVGANFGLYAVHLGRDPKVKSILAFEPDIRNYNQLAGNLYLNGLSEKVSVHQVAVSDHDGTVSFQKWGSTSTGQSRVSDTGANTEKVRSITLDSLHLEKKRLALKIDVEGHELPALRGASGLLETNECFVQVESFPQNVDAVKEFFSEAGYRWVNTIDSDHYFTNMND